MKGLTDARSKDVCMVPKTPDSKVVLLVRRTLPEKDNMVPFVQRKCLFSFTHASSPFPVRNLGEFLQI